MFGEPRGEHCWRQVISDAAAFEINLYAAVRMSADEFEQYRLRFRTYRDKFVAHLDEDLVALMPHLDAAWESIRFYHAELLKEAPQEDFGGLPANIDEYHAIVSAEAAAVYEQG